MTIRVMTERSKVIPVNRIIVYIPHIPVRGGTSYLLDRQLSGKRNIPYIPVGRSADDKANEARLVKLWSQPEG